MKRFTELEFPFVSKSEYLLIIMLVLLSGHPMFIDRTYYAVAGFFSILYIIIKGRKRNFNKLWIYCMFYILLAVCQQFILGSISYFGVLNFIFKIIFGAIVLRSLGERFRFAYLNVIYVVSCISIVLFSMQRLGLSLPILWSNGSITNSIGIYCWLSTFSELPRNLGIFWEPGAFSAYILLIPMLYLKNLSDLLIDYRFRKKIFIIFIAFITTLSTTGYIVSAVIAIYYYATKSKNSFKTFLVYLPLVLILVYYIFSSLDFVGDKLESQYETAIENKGEYSDSRYGALLFDQYYIEKHPFVGNGLDVKTRFADHPFLLEQSIGMGNGLTGFLANWGFVALLFYCVLLYQSLPLKKRDRIALIAIVLLQFNGEYLLNFPLYLALPFIVLPYNYFIKSRKNENSLAIS